MVIVTFRFFFLGGGGGRDFGASLYGGGGLFFNEGGGKNCYPRPLYLCVDSGNLALMSILRNFPSVGSYYLRIVKPSLLCCIRLDHYYVNDNRRVTVESEPLMPKNLCNCHLLDTVSILYAALRATSIGVTKL